MTVMCFIQLGAAPARDRVRDKFDKCTKGDKYMEALELTSALNEFDLEGLAFLCAPIYALFSN